jgi:hypothetical protein
MLTVSQQSSHRQSYRLAWRVHSRFGQSSLEHFARSPVVQQIEHRGCMEAPHTSECRARRLQCFDVK